MSRLSRPVLALILPITLVAVLLAEPPQPEKQPGETFAAATKKVGPAVFMIGSSKGGHGTGFLISKEHRLIATNAHVADIMHPGGKMFAIRNDTATTYKVEKAYYHPGLKRHKNGPDKPSVVSMDPADGDVDPRSPDVAILQLAAGGPELLAAVPLADATTLDDLLALPVAVLGFPGHDSHWPDTGDVVSATFHDGSVSRITGFDLQPAEGAAGRKMVQYTMQTGGGYSGSPVFLPDGRVVAVHNMGRVDKNPKTGVIKPIAHGIRADMVREILTHHKLAELKGVATVEPKPIDPTTVPPTTYTKETALARLRELEYLGAVQCYFEYEFSVEPNSIQSRWPSLADDVCAMVEALDSVFSLEVRGATDRTMVRIGRLKGIYSLDVSAGRISDTGLAQISKLKLGVLRLNGNRLISSDGLVSLQDMKGLNTLSLSGTRVTTWGKLDLKQFPELDNVNLSATPVTDEAVRALAGCPKLKYLVVSNTGITDQALVPFKTVPLWGFDATYSAITDDGLANIALDDKRGYRLELSATGVTGAAFKSWKPNDRVDFAPHACPLTDDGLAAVVVAFPKLSSFSLGDNAKVTIKGLSALKSAVKLTSVSLAYPGLTPEHVRALAVAPQLESLSLSGPGVTDEVLRELVAQLPKLKSLTLIDSPVTDAGIKHLSASKVMDITLSRCPKLTDESMKHLSQMPDLVRLLINECTLTDRGLQHLAQQTKLTWISLEKTNVTDAGLPLLGKIPALGYLRLIDLEITGKGLRALTGCPKLSAITIHKCPLTDAGFGELGQCKGFGYLELSDCPKITAAGFKSFRDCPIEDLTINNCPGVGDDLLNVFAGELGGLHLRSLYVRGTKVTRDAVLKIKPPTGWDRKKGNGCLVRGDW